MATPGPVWSYGPGPPAVAPPAERLRWAHGRRTESDYLFSFWSAMGWTLLTLGLYLFYVFYQLVRRMRDHNRRRLDLLEAAYELAWARAGSARRQDELRPRFERALAALVPLRGLSGEFRDPAVWTLLLLVGQSIAQFAICWLLDADLVKHSAAEAAAEHELAGIYAELGAAVGDLPPAPLKSPHRYGPRIVVSLLTCGLYGFWWIYDLMEEANRHFQRDWVWEDAFASAAGVSPGIGA